MAYSSGLDSTSQALYQRALGKQVTLFHIKHLNSSYPDEFDTAIRFARDFKFPILVIEPKFIKQSAYIDNPVKNQTIPSYMLDYGITIGCMEYGMGNFRADKLAEQTLGYETTDAVELFDVNQFICTIYPEYRYHDMPFDKYGAFEFVMNDNPRAYVRKCLSTLREKDGTTYTLHIKKDMSNADVLRTALGRDVVKARWHTVLR